MECNFAVTLVHRMPLPSYISMLSNHVIIVMYLSQVLYSNFCKCHINRHIIQGSVMGHVITKCQSYSWYHHLIVMYKEAVFTDVSLAMMIDWDTNANNTAWVNKNNTYMQSKLQSKKIWKNVPFIVWKSLISYQFDLAGLWVIQLQMGGIHKTVCLFTTCSNSYNLFL